VNNEKEWVIECQSTEPNSVRLYPRNPWDIVYTYPPSQETKAMQRMEPESLSECLALWRDNFRNRAHAHYRLRNVVTGDILPDELL